MEPKKEVCISILSHLSEEYLSDGNTGEKVKGRVPLLKMILKSLHLFNDMSKVPILILDTGDYPINKLIDELSEFGFNELRESSKEGFFVDDLPNDNRLYLRYKRGNVWGTEFKDTKFRFLQACEAALKYAVNLNSNYLLALEGDTIIFGKNYIDMIKCKLGEKDIFASCSVDKGVETGFWMAKSDEVLTRFKEVFWLSKPLSAQVENAFDIVFSERINLDNIIIGERSLDQKVSSQENLIKLSWDYYKKYPYSWITHLSKKQLVGIENYFEKFKYYNRLPINNYEYFPTYKNLKTRIKTRYYRYRRRMLEPLISIKDSQIQKKINKSKELIIQIPYGGLGDHLIYSSLPRLLWEQKGIRTLISNKSLYRNKGIRKFVWGRNPYVKFTNKKGWFSNTNQRVDLPAWDEYFQELFALKGEGSTEVYYEPRLIKEISGRDIVHVSFGYSGNANGYNEKVFQKELINYLKHNVNNFVLITYDNKKNELAKQIIEIFKPLVYNVSTVEQLSDVLFSANKRHLLYSGAASLSAALGLPSIVLCNIRSEPHFQYRINKYIDLVK